MNFSHKIEKGVCIVLIDGNIALDGTNEVKEYVRKLMEEELNGLIINFKSVNFIDSSGIGLIVSIFKSLQKKQKKFALSDLSQKNKEIFSMTRLDKILMICESDEQAIDAMVS